MYQLEAMMEIVYDSLENFHEGVYFFLTKGVKFEADAAEFIIRLTGGF